MNRRSFLLTAGVAMVVLPNAAICQPVIPQPKLLASRLIVANRTAVRIRLGRDDLTRPLLMKVHGSGLWIDELNFEMMGGRLVSSPIKRRLIPGSFLGLNPGSQDIAPVRGVDVRYAHLPFDSSRTTLELWSA
jgi:hypothetical protein